MSDGPHRSLPMRRAWKRVAERAANLAFTPEEVSAAMMPALEQDCRSEVTPQFIRQIRATLEERDSSLFKDITPQIDVLRSRAGCGMESAILDNVSAITRNDAMAIEVLLDAFESVISDRAARCARQVEEHYLRKSNVPRAAEVRSRLEESIAKTNCGAIAEGILELGQSRRPQPALKQHGLDDGVTLP